MHSNKIAYIKDPHLMFGFANNIRKPARDGQSWVQDIKKKLEFIKDEMIKRNIHTLVISGDLFDHAKKTDWTFRKFLQNKKVLQEVFVENGIDIYTVQGNHDMFDGNATINETVFGEMCIDTIIHLTTNPIILQTSSGIIKISGFDYSFTKEDQHAKFESIVDNSIINVVVSHTNISPNENQFVDFTYNELTQKYPNINVHLCGHYHLGYSPALLNDVVFINPWNMTRVVRDYQVKLGEHTPEVVFLDFNHYSKENLDWVETVILPHRVFEDAFNEEVVSILEESEKFKFFEGSENIDLNNILVEDLDNSKILTLLINQNIQGDQSEKEKILLKTIAYLGKD